MCSNEVGDGECIPALGKAAENLHESTSVRSEDSSPIR